MKTCVVIPTYNESKTISNIIKRIHNLNLVAVIIDDGSKDNTADIAQENGAVVIKNPKNEGQGASLIKGFNYALKNNFAAVITMDGDGQHIPEDALNFIKVAKDSPQSIFIGNRMSNPKNMPFTRRFTNMFMSHLISLVINQRIPDTQCGFRLIKYELLKRLKLKTLRYETESEILVTASRLGYKIYSLPIRTIYQGQRSRINPLVDTFRFIKFILREILNFYH